jgi:signal transduction histidine kinase
MAITGGLSKRSADRLAVVDARLRETGMFGAARIRLQRQAFQLMPAYVPGDNVLVEDVRIQLAQARTLGPRLSPEVLRSIDRLAALMSVSLVDRNDLVTAAIVLERITEGESVSHEQLLADATDDVYRDRDLVASALALVTALLVVGIWIAPQRMVSPLRPLVHHWLRGMLDQRRTTLRLERMALASEAAASLAHELRNPLAGITLALQNLEKESDDLAPRVRPLVTELERVTRTLNEHLGAMRGSPGEPIDVDIHRLLSDLAELLGYEAAPGVTVEAYAPVGLTCRTREDQLRQALLNLGLNALQAVERGGRVRFDAETVDGLLRIRVQDTGGGFPPSILEGGPLPLSSSRPGGSGLGLRVVKRAVAELGGQVVLSNAGGGATAEIVFPCRRGAE